MTLDPRLNGLVRKEHPGPPVVAFLGDSLMGGSGDVPTDLTIDRVAARALGVIDCKSAQGGTGWLANGQTNNKDFQPYGHESRVNALVACNPDVLVAVGSLNDDEWDKNAATRYPSIKSKVYDTIRTYRSRLPRTAIVVIGPEPSSSDRLANASHCDNIRAVRDAVREAGGPAAGYAFVDWVGASYGTWADGSRVAFNASGSYSAGDVVLYNGAYWRVDEPWRPDGGTPADPDAPTYRLTAVMTGTGRMSAEKRDGTRDLLLSADGVHPTNAGSEALGLALAECIVTGLALIAADNTWWADEPAAPRGLLADRPAGGAVIWPKGRGPQSTVKTWPLTGRLGTWYGGGSLSGSSKGITLDSLRAAMAAGSNALHLPCYVSSDNAAILSGNWQITDANGNKTAIYNHSKTELTAINQAGGPITTLDAAFAAGAVGNNLLLVEFAPGSNNQGATNSTIQGQEKTFWENVSAMLGGFNQVVALTWAASAEERSRLRQQFPGLRIVCSINNNDELNKAGTDYDVILLTEGAEAGAWGNASDTGKPLWVGPVSQPANVAKVITNATNGGVEDFAGGFGYTSAVLDEFNNQKHWTK
nr:MAG TPA: cytosolic glycerophosphodiester phosphodiesterase [Caudoviricetes sp.]